MKSKDTKRTSFDLTADNSERLKDFSEAMGSNYSNVVNYLLRVMVGASPPVRKSIVDYCNSKIKDLSRYIDGKSEFEKQDLMQIEREYQEIAYFFAVGLTAEQTRRQTMRKIYLKEGYLVIPDNKDWVVLDNFTRPEDCMYAGVVDTREPLDGSRKYNAKHYVFFCDYKYGKDYPLSLQDKVFNACVEKDPSFKEILNDVVYPDYGGKEEIVSNMKNLDAYKSSPCPGLHNIVEHGDPIYWNRFHPDYEPPFGCEIIRN